tara:strand:+ start:10117 stop:10932 length:816 start_codon:yes stop_codon:yes gene_type:complete
VSQEQEKSNLKVEGADALMQEALESLESRLSAKDESPEKEEVQDSTEKTPVEKAPEKEPTPTVNEDVHSEEVTALKASLAEAEEAYKKKEKEFKEMYEQFVRLNADFDNFRKRNAREKSELRKYGAETLSRDMLQVFDNFERALGTLGDASDSVREGIEMVFRQFLDIMKNHGIERFEAKGQPFDYNRHEALSTVETDEVDPDTVYEVFQAGYTLHERLLRPARVVVAKAPAKPAQPAEAAQVVDESSSAEEKSAPSQEENEGSVDTNEES